MRRKKNFTYATGTYYFNILNGQSSITISRESRGEAEIAFLRYIKQRKNCEWLGKWNGKQFEDNQTPANKAA